MNIGKTFLSVVLLLIAVPIVASAQIAGVSLTAQMIQEDLDRPIFLTAPANDSRLFVVEQTGRIVIIENGVKLEAAFLDIRNQISAGGERGLLGLAFHPNYAANGRFFVNYTNRSGDTRIVEYKVSTSNPNVADMDSAQELLAVDQPYSNHNGGWIGFGPDGYLYIGMGDGGAGGDPDNRAQNKNSLLGKILRIDIDTASPYAIPPTNPFAQGGGSPEIFVLGVRNPWRNAFDGKNLFIADVGQTQWEEISVITASNAGINMGWPFMEGTHCFRPRDCVSNGLKLPVYEYSHSEGCSLTGGFVYRGNAIPELNGQYFFSDYCSGFIRSFNFMGGAIARANDWTSQFGDIGNVTSFGRDSEGELYIMNADGDLLKIVRAN